MARNELFEINFLNYLFNHKVKFMVSHVVAPNVLPGQIPFMCIPPSGPGAGSLFSTVESFLLRTTLQMSDSQERRFGQKDKLKGFNRNPLERHAGSDSFSDLTCPRHSLSTSP